MQGGKIAKNPLLGYICLFRLKTSFKSRSRKIEVLLLYKSFFYRNCRRFFVSEYCLKRSFWNDFLIFSNYMVPQCCLHREEIHNTTEISSFLGNSIDFPRRILTVMS